MSNVRIMWLMRQNRYKLFTLFSRHMSGQHNGGKVEAWDIPASWEALNTINPIRQCVEIHFVDAMKKCKKELIKISLGDPAVFGNLSPHPAVKESLIAAASMMYSGMTSTSGLLEARQAVAEHLSKYPSKHCISEDDVHFTCGTHGALEVCFKTLCEPGKSILFSRPCYTIYKCLADAFGIIPRYYNLLPERGWEVDLNDLERQIDQNVAALVVNNPSNPCGSVYSKQHLLDIIAIAEKHRIPIITDEVYADMVFKDKEFHPIGPLSDNVPVLTCGGISKKFLVPGWRCGWIVVHDRNGLFHMVKPGIANLLMKLIAPATVIQAAVPGMLRNVPDSFHSDTMETFENNAKLCYSKLKDTPGITPVMPAGAMYMMVKIDLSVFPDFEDDVAFMKNLIAEQGVVGLPGSIFQYPASIRIVLIMPLEKLNIACERITQFCLDHYKPIS